MTHSLHSRYSPRNTFVNLPHPSSFNHSSVNSKSPRKNGKNGQPGVESPPDSPSRVVVEFNYLKTALTENPYYVGDKFSPEYGTTVRLHDIVVVHKIYPDGNEVCWISSFDADRDKYFKHTHPLYLTVHHPVYFESGEGDETRVDGRVDGREDGGEDGREDGRVDGFLDRSVLHQSNRIMGNVLQKQDVMDLITFKTCVLVNDNIEEYIYLMSLDEFVSDQPIPIYVSRYCKIIEFNPF